MRFGTISDPANMTTVVANFCFSQRVDCVLVSSGRHERRVAERQR
jgi:hypothetical protein